MKWKYTLWKYKVHLTRNTNSYQVSSWRWLTVHFKTKWLKHLITYRYVWYILRYTVLWYVMYTRPYSWHSEKTPRTIPGLFRWWALHHAGLGLWLLRVQGLLPRGFRWRFRFANFTKTFLISEIAIKYNYNLSRVTYIYTHIYIYISLHKNLLSCEALPLQSRYSSNKQTQRLRASTACCEWPWRTEASWHNSHLLLNISKRTKSIHITYGIDST